MRVRRDRDHFCTKTLQTDELHLHTLRQLEASRKLVQRELRGLVSWYFPHLNPLVFAAWLYFPMTSSVGRRERSRETRSFPMCWRNGIYGTILNPNTTQFFHAQYKSEDKANVTQFYATGFCTLEPPMPCVQDCELILMRSGSDKADKRNGILTQHMASLQSASYFAIAPNRFLPPPSFDLRSSKFDG